MMKIVRSRQASCDIQGIYDYICSRDCEINAYKQIEIIRKEINRLKTSPHIGQLTERGYRKLSTNPYVIVYSISEDCIKIVRVFDGRQNWQQNLFKPT